MLTLLSCLPTAAQELSWGGQISLMGGYADNPVAASEGDPNPLALQAATATLSPDAWLRFQFRDVQLTLNAHSHVAGYFGATRSAQQWHQLQVEMAGYVGEARLYGAVGAAGYHFTAFPNEGFLHGVGRLGVRVGHTVVGRAELAALYRGFVDQATASTDELRRDVELSASVSAEWSPTPAFVLSSAYRFMWRWSNETAVNRGYHAPSLSVSGRVRLFSYSAVWSVWLRGDDAGGIDHFHQLQIHGAYQLTSWLSVRGSYSLGADRTTLEALEFTSHAAQLGVGVHWGGQRSAAPSTRRPDTLQADGCVRFFWEGKADSVQVAGSFSGWRPLPLRRSGAAYTASFAIPPGRYEYQFIIDGRFMAPPGAQRLVSNGFDSKNAFLVVPPSAAKCKLPRIESIE